jgi:diguanylate cyclase (GGDEF)-like protein
LLVTITQRLFAVIRQSDVLIRWGGEEFLIVSRQSERSEATILAARILHAIGAEPFALKGIPTTVRRGCSVGFASFPWFPEAPGAVHYEKVIEMADRALYLAKRAGRNRAVGMLPVSDAPQRIEQGKQLPVDALETTHMTVLGPMTEAPVKPLRW